MTSSTTRVVIIGGGFGGLYAAKSLRRAPVDLTVVDRRNFHLFQPLLYQVASGELSTKAGVYAHASRMLDDPRSRPVVRFFFDNLLPIANLSRLERDEELFPTFSAAIGASMREETQRFLEHEIFEGSGSWRAALTAPYTFVNGPLAAFYGIRTQRLAALLNVPLAS